MATNDDALLAQGIQPVAAPPAPTAATVAQPSAITPAAISSTGYTAATGTSQNVDPTLRSVQSNETVKGQLGSLIDENSPFLQQARSRAQQAMAGRGLLNSSIGQTAADSAVYDAAMPIATADANAYGQTARDNQSVTNQTAQFNAGQTSDMTKFNSTSSNTASQFGADAANRASTANAQLGLQAQEDTANNKFKADSQNADAQNKILMQDLDNKLKASMVNMDTSTKLSLENMGDSTKLALGNIEASYKMLMQSSQSAADLYKQGMVNITNTMTNKDMTPDAKQAAVNNQLGMINAGLGIVGAISNLNLDTLLTFGGALSGATAVPSPAPAPTPAPGQGSPYAPANEYPNGVFI
jgi:hypothetical protein